MNRKEVVAIRKFLNLNGDMSKDDILRQLELQFIQIESLKVQIKRTCDDNGFTELLRTIKKDIKIKEIF